MGLPSSVPPSFESFSQFPSSAPLPCSQLPPGISKPLFTFLAWSLGIRNFNIFADMEVSISSLNQVSACEIHCSIDIQYERLRGSGRLMKRDAQEGPETEQPEQ